ncbi:endonuclease domain-containing protein [Actinomadura viridis]|uniref:endonuclease domain-containing protein n=1 Tax=Actinomadura viridis TaxID=58110 RepID=UPI0036A62031
MSGPEEHRPGDDHPTPEPSKPIGPGGTNPGPPTGLEDLPERRREALLWHHALTLDYYGVDELVRETSPWPCPVPGGLAPASRIRRVAVLGNDNRYHLLIDGHPICAHTKHPRRTPTGSAWPHQDSCHWWTDGTYYRLQRPPGSLPAPTDLRPLAARPVRWLVYLTEVATAPELVERAARCPINVRLGHWPRYLGEGAPMRRLITTLMDALGPECHACGHNLGIYIDHDHFSGYVRGLVCPHCNAKLDTCPHPSRCRWADYLNAPPAAPLRLRYPKISKSLTGHRNRIAYLGIDPFTHLRPTR